MKPLASILGWGDPLNIALCHKWVIVERRFGVVGLKQVATKGIYYLFQGTTIVYVGQSNNLFKRLTVHLNDEIKIFDGFNYKECKESKLNKKERKAITKYKPLYNSGIYIPYVRKGEKK